MLGQMYSAPAGSSTQAARLGQVESRAQEESLRRAESLVAEGIPEPEVPPPRTRPTQTRRPSGQMAQATSAMEMPMRPSRLPRTEALLPCSPAAAK